MKEVLIDILDIMRSLVCSARTNESFNEDKVDSMRCVCTFLSLGATKFAFRITTLCSKPKFDKFAYSWQPSEIMCVPGAICSLIRWHIRRWAVSTARWHAQFGYFANLQTERSSHVSEVWRIIMCRVQSGFDGTEDEVIERVLHDFPIDEVDLDQSLTPRLIPREKMAWWDVANSYSGELHLSSESKCTWGR